ncbi:vWA domain-containing protein [Desulfurococcus mucosus]|uniref:von Willebrand factor type A n=1 Tax=Desulfurococcus mucosus (strain ATCC 35584 / DSM 2162 / JCM 9187 / O7/1) TaxID=765177 RepID=E8R870_DESM0|nr:VWA domain-containing protein [Desulfurococcus mucosus]ADV64696.1 von Willebrand factor type A [Desulfurococcus mucosus DSM 2162]
MSGEGGTGFLKGIDYGDPVVKYRGWRVRRLAEKLAGRRLNLQGALAVDVFYILYLPAPVPREGAGEPGREIIEALLDSPNLPVIRGKTLMDSFTSSIAAAVFLSEVKMLEAALGHTQGAGRGVDYSEARRIVERALTTVSMDVENVKMLKSIAEGLEPGSLSQLSFEEDAVEVLRLARDVDARRILEVLRGLKPWELGIEKRRRRFKHGEITGYEYGRDIERVAPSNLALPEDVFYIKYLQRRLLLYEKAVEESMGPVYVLLDKSGSMDGTKITWGKAVAVSLYLKAVRTGREFYIRFFDSQPYPLLRVRRRPRPGEALRLIDHVVRVKGAGGTDISRAIITACTDIRTGSAGRESDIVLITDGVDRIAESMVRLNLKKADARLITVMVMGDNDGLKRVSQKYMSVEKLDRESMLRVIELK